MAAIYRLYLHITLFCLLQIILLYFHTFFFLKCECPGTSTEPPKPLEKNWTNSILKRSIEIENENNLLRKLLKTTEHKLSSNTVAGDGMRTLPRRKESKAMGSIEFRTLVTIILYEEMKTNFSCLKARTNYLQKLFPDVNILFTSRSTSIGSAFNLLFPKVKTKYFYFLNIERDFFENFENNVSRLLRDLQEVPELDFISGAVLNRDKLEIPCYRLNLCNWTLSQKYEYKRSIDEIMICDNIDSSFLGKTRSIRKIFPEKKTIFDERMEALATTDFFLRAKKAGAVCGIRPEVMIKVSRNSRCYQNITQDTRLQQYRKLLPFAHKHKVFRFEDTDSTLDLCGDDSPILGTDVCDEPTAHRIMLNGGHWAKQGTFAYPYIINNLRKCLFEVTDLLETKGILFYVDAGVALGALKMRSILPWDAGDVDIGVYHNNPSKFASIIESFAQKNNYTFKNLFSKDLIHVFCASGQGDKMGGLVSMFVEDKQPWELIKIKTNGRWIPYKQDIFKDMREEYNTRYLQHVMYDSNNHEKIHCTVEGHNACLPDFRKNDGTYSDLFCKV